MCGIYEGSSTHNNSWSNKINITKIIIKEYFEYIREKGVGLISGAETAGKWKSDDKTEYYYALTIEMK